MELVDANALRYAVNEDADRDESARAWLDAALSGGDTVAFSRVALLAFVRLATKEDCSHDRPAGASRCRDTVVASRGGAPRRTLAARSGGPRERGADTIVGTHSAMTHDQVEP